jgi:hypothetical protein
LPPGGQAPPPEKRLTPEKGIRIKQERKKTAMANTLTEMVKDLRGLLDEKDRLEAEAKKNKAAIEAKKQEIAQQMIDEDTPRISCGGYVYGLQAKTAYNKIADETLEAAGIDYLETLREEGFGHLIKETVNARTLQGAMAAFVDEHGELTDGLLTIIKPFDYNDVYSRKETRKKK